MLKTNNLIKDKSFQFAINIVKLYKSLVKEGLRGQTKKDFLAKMNIVLKEANETEYWLELLLETDYLSEEKGKVILNECKEICRILNSIVKTTKTIFRQYTMIIHNSRCTMHN